MTQRWRGLRVEHHGTRKVAVLRDNRHDRELRVYWRLGMWRRFDNDDPVEKGAGPCAKRLIDREDAT